jgi:hypothetical protein
MNLRKRVEKLERVFKPTAPRVSTRDLTGVEWEELLAAVDGALMPADADLVQQIRALVEELAKVPWRNQTTKELYLTEDGQEQPTPHFFCYWLWGLQAGSWRLPDPIPREVLEGFCRLHGAVLRRCEDCLSAFGNACSYQHCPVCQSTRISVKKLIAPSCDAAWQYAPRPERAMAKSAKK